MTNRVAEVNRELKARGYKDRLRAGKGYYYFTGPEAERWYTSSVYVNRADVFTVAEWLAEYGLLKNDWRNQ